MEGVARSPKLLGHSASLAELNIINIHKADHAIITRNRGTNTES